ncbi:MAG TPA: preprotein translocase subunit SecE, partial [Clostridia bacterium]|nr:preprotein translocase subunit SecE [Clostridia bacterium]
ASKTKKPSRFIAMVKNAGRFFKDVFHELKKVTWPSRKEVRINATTVLVITLISAIIIGLLDWGMSSLYRLIIEIG